MATVAIDMNTSAFDLWVYLSQNLSGTLDTHGVCGGISQHISDFTNCKSMTALNEINGNSYFDAWLSAPNQKTSQHRWTSEDDLEVIHNLLEDYDIKIIQKHEIEPNNAIYDMVEETLLVVPLQWPKHGNMIIPQGILVVADAHETLLADLDMVSDLATMLTTLIERAVLSFQRDRQAIEFAITSDISQRLNSSLQLQDIFAQISDNIKRMLDVESLSLGLINQNNGRIEFIPQLMGTIFLEIPRIELEPGTGIAGWVADHRQPAIINDVYNDPRFSKNSDKTSGFHTRSMICVPLLQEGKVIGVMQAINKRNGDFGNHDKALLEAISGPLSAAIVNANLHENVVSEKRRIEAMFQSMSEGLLTIGPDHSITQANDSLMTLLTLRNDQVIGNNVTEVMRLKDQDILLFMAEVSTYRPTDKLADYPQLLCDVQVGNVYKPVMISGAPVREDDGALNEIVLVISDLTDIREVERMRDNFFHTIIHELRTPLATILLYARMLLKGNLNDEEKTHRFLKNIETESDRLQAMVRQMLQHAKLESSEFKRSELPVNLNGVFDEIMPAMRDRAREKGVTVVDEIQEDLPEILGDRETIYMIIKNLIDNAVKYTLEGKIQVNAKAKRTKVHIEIADDGIGIPEQAMPQLFGRFFRAKTAVEKGIAGTGLGLNMVKEGVEKHGGKIQAKSVEGKGTTFFVEFPIPSD